MKFLFASLFISLISFSKKEYFQVISSSSEKEITMLLDHLEEKSSTPDNNAYRGALLMRKAEFLKVPKDKLACFKEGRLLLEKEIDKNTGNTEYRFLRLIIQENAPKVLRYNTNLKEDAAWIKKNYQETSSEVRLAIKSYASHSSSLNL